MSAVYDYLRAAAIVVAFFAARQSKKSALSFDLYLSAWFGAGCFLFPRFVASKIFVSSDHSHVFGVQTVGASFITMALFQYLCNKSRDETVLGSISVSKALGFLPLLFASVYTFVMNQKSFHHPAFCFILTIFSGIWLINVALLFEIRPAIGRREHGGPVSVVCRLMFLVFLLHGLADLAFPSTVASIMKVKSSVGLNFLTQSIGALLISNIFTSWYAPCFLRKEDRKSFIDSQLVYELLVALASGYFCYMTKADTSATLLFVAHSLAGMLLPVVGCVLMYREDHVITNTHYTRSKRN
ncbi:uncharacterized protein LOC133196594 [Saccostrea echinata]|uniref:uncharacterized protein LOC133196594 n=1 Tax=Saccostrea echinata TaxID=191078 RepID=UPI002A825A80|nr:uncharacterized protein LOC133196594 [Saccostrea echinata]